MNKRNIFVRLLNTSFIGIFIAIAYEITYKNHYKPPFFYKFRRFFKGALNESISITIAHYQPSK